MNVDLLYDVLGAVALAWVSIHCFRLALKGRRA